MAPRSRWQIRAPASRVAKEKVSEHLQPIPGRHVSTAKLRSPPQSKIKVALEPAAWHQYRIENVWVDLLEDGTCELRSVPFYAYDLSFGDRISVEVREGEVYFKDVVRRGGHRTYRIIVPRKFDALAKAAFERRWAPIESAGCSYEGTGAPLNLFAVDVPPGVDVKQVESILDAGQRDSTWDYERACPAP